VKTAGATAVGGRGRLAGGRLAELLMRPDYIYIIYNNYLSLPENEYKLTI
jgi:hypothetical protein